MERRHQFRFMTDKVPDKKVIEKIVQTSFNLTPIKNDTWFFYVDIYGPEYAEDKRKLCLQTSCAIPEKNEDHIYNQYSQGMPREKHIQEDLFPLLDDYHETGIRNPGLPAFNTQVMAPYLFVFRYKLNNFKPNNIMVKMCARDKNEWQAPYENVVKIDYAWPGASMLAYVMAVLANKEGLDASFCQCFWKSNYNYNSIYNNESDEVLFFLSIGYGDKEKDKVRYPRIKVAKSKVLKWM